MAREAETATDDLRRELADLSDETLLSQLIEKPDDFEPAALEARIAELESRGVHRSRIERRRAEHAASRQDHDTGPMEAVADFEDRIFAQQAANILEKKDISALIQDTASLGTREFPVPDVEGFHVVLVPRPDAERARLMLSTFAPAAGDEEE